MEPTVTQYGSHMVMTNVNKSTKTKYLNIDTRFRDNYSASSPSNYQLTLPERVTEVKSISARTIEIPMTYYNISSTLGNNAMTITSTSTNIPNTIVVPDGQYTISTLTTMINQLINAISGSPDITYSTNANNFSVFTETCLGDYTLNFNVTAADQCSFTNNNNLQFTLGWLLGFRSSSYSLVHSTSITSEGMVDLAGPRYLYLVVDEFLNTGPRSFVTLLKTSSINQNVLARIPINTTENPYGSILTASTAYGNMLSDHRTYSGKVNLERMNIQLVNECGIPMNLNGMDFTFCLELQHV